MKQLVQLAYAIGDRVVIKEIDATGTVYAAQVYRDGVEYQVKWFGNGDRHSEWFRFEELREAK